jgi:hypothetical protein
MRPADGYSIVFGAPIPFPLGQFASGRTEVMTGRPYPCSLLPITPTSTPPTGLAKLNARVKATVESLTLGYSDSRNSRRFADATIAAFTSGPETFGTRSAVTRVPVG